MFMLCSLVLPLLLVKEGYIKKGELIDSRSVSIYYTKEDPVTEPVQHIILYATIDPVAEKLAKIRGFTDMKSTCMIGTQGANMLVAIRESPSTI